ncbi:hypothetical protein GUITHDRAFT_116387 [Guillardia theta CCMP2712]|uniref:Fibronectin type-III domain-containing protein n=1 Tax=Guillardia theta (strain CCMP2712) TaxID=905079 RepID=L1IME8_GUITC|nr:hypothetical protein GUITHDRAFT_116387 [Guillardia theta CCMP2712]EKX37426.1 hypothetical protein GUITHDRAFT_116387 [Guillardia theta CCMP2712]|eukprot:XP_005824406.1 hypothetical protein GUITHDRAFT_116387 [Guillardia theta CCMP2712]
MQTVLGATCRSDASSNLCPSAPTGLSFVVSGPLELTLTWNAVNTSTSYVAVIFDVSTRAEYYFNAGSSLSYTFTSAASTDMDGKQFSGLEKSGEYQASVWAVNSFGGGKSTLPYLDAFAADYPDPPVIVSFCSELTASGYFRCNANPTPQLIWNLPSDLGLGPNQAVTVLAFYIKSSNSQAFESGQVVRVLPSSVLQKDGTYAFLQMPDIFAQIWIETKAGNGSASTSSLDGECFGSLQVQITFDEVNRGGIIPEASAGEPSINLRIHVEIQNFLPSDGSMYIVLPDGYSFSGTPSVSSTVYPSNQNFGIFQIYGCGATSCLGVSQAICNRTTYPCASILVVKTFANDWFSTSSFDLVLTNVNVSPFATPFSKWKMATLKKRSGVPVVVDVFEGTLHTIPNQFNNLSMQTSLLAVDSRPEFFIKFTTFNSMLFQNFVEITLPPQVMIVDTPSVLESIFGLTSIRRIPIINREVCNGSRRARSTGNLTLSMLVPGFNSAQKLVNVSVFGLSLARLAGWSDNFLVSTLDKYSQYMDQGSVSAVNLGSPNLTLQSQRPLNSPTIGMTIVTLTGEGFSLVGYNPLLQDSPIQRGSSIGGSQCLATSWKSDSSILCMLHPIAGLLFGEVVVTVQRKIASSNSLVFFDYGSVSTCTMSNVGARTTSTVIGSSFMTSDVSVIMRVSFTSSEFSKWVSDTSVLSLPAMSPRSTDGVKVTIFSGVATSSQAMTFDLYMYQKVTTNTMVFETVNLNVIGTYHLISLAIRVGATACERTSWLSSSSVDARLSQRGAASLKFVITTSRPFSASESITFHSHYLTSTKLANVNANRISDIFLGDLVFPISLRARIGNTGAEATEWTSLTSLKAKVTKHSKASISLAVTHVTTSTASQMTSYNMPSVSTSPGANSRMLDGSRYIELSGMGYGLQSVTPSGRVGVTRAAQTAWKSDSSVVCSSLRAESSGSSSIALTIRGSVGSLTESVSLEAAVVSTFMGANTRVSGSAVTLVGAMLGKESVCPGARAGGTSCGATQWVADTSITCIRAGLTSGLGGSSKVVMTLGRSRGQGSISEALSFDAGSVQGLLNQVNAPRGQAGVATIVGKEFGPYGMTGQVRAGGSSAASSLWTSSTSIVCKIREGSGGSHGMIITSAGRASTGTAVLSYDSVGGEASWSWKGRANLASRGGEVVLASVAGQQGWAWTGQARVGSTGCERSYWLSSSGVICKSGRGPDSSRGVALTMAARTVSVTEAMSYDEAATADGPMANSGKALGRGVTLSGSGFGTALLSVVVRAGATSATQTTWGSDTGVSCKTASGSGTSLSGVVSVGRMVGGTHTELVSMDAGLMSTVSRGNVAAAQAGSADAQGSITLFGRGMGLVQYSPTSAIGGSRAEKTAWQSDSTVASLLSSGTGRSMAVRMSIAEQARVSGSLSAAVSYDPGSLTSSVAGGNGPVQTMVLAMSGTGRYVEYTNAVRMQATASRASFWQSSTSLQCATSAGMGGSNVLQVSVARGVSSQTESSSYDVQLVSTAKAGNLGLGGAVAILVGLSRTLGHTARARMSGTASSLTLWISSSSIASKLAAGVRGSSSLQSTIGVVVGSATEVMSYDSTGMSLSAESVSNFPSSSTRLTTIAGTSVLPGMLSSTLRLGKTSSTATVWSSGTMLLCKVASGTGATLPISMTSSLLGGSTTETSSYDMPSVSTSPGANSRMLDGSRYIELSGTGYGLQSVTPSGRVGVTRAAQTAWKSDSSIVCSSLRAESSGSSSIALTIRGSVGSLTESVSLEAAVVSTFMGANTRVSGSAVTLVGAMLGKESVCPGARAGGTSCGATQWVADTSITCIRAGLTSGLGGSSKVVMTLGRSRGQGSISEALSFDAGSVQGLLNQVNAPRGQAGVATIVGKEFGPYGMTGQVRAGGSSAASSLWTSSTSIVCKIREGSGGSHGMIITSAGRASTGTAVLSYDSVGGEASWSWKGRANLASRGGEVVLASVAGQQGWAWTGQARVGLTGCERSYWLSSSGVICKSGRGPDSSRGVALTMAARTVSVTEAMSYDEAATADGPMANSGKALGRGVTLSGSGFGTALLSVVVRAGATSATQTTWGSDTGVSCKTASGSGTSLSGVVSVGRMVGGTHTELVSMDAGLMSTVSRGNVAAAQAGSADAQGSITLFGRGMGLVQYSPTSAIGGSRAEKTAWQSDSTVASLLSSGTGRSMAVRMSIAEQARVSGSLSAAVSYDPGSLTSSVAGGNGPVQTMVLAMSGTGRYVEYTNAVRMQATASRASFWQSSTSLQCATSAGMGGSNVLQVSVARGVSSQTESSSYDVQLVSTAKAGNLGLGGAVAILVGLSRTLGHTARARMSGTASSLTLWISSSSIASKLAAGVRGSSSLQSTIGVVVGSATEVMSYDSTGMSLSAESVSNFPSSSTRLTTIAGTSVLPGMLSSTLRLGKTSSTATVWSSGTMLLCKVASGTGATLPISMTSSLLGGSTTETSSYDMPSVSTSPGANSRMLDGSRYIELSGMGYGLQSVTPSGRVGGTRAAQTAWKSDSSIVCSSLRAESSGSSSIALTIRGSVGSLTESVSLEAAVVSTFMGANTRVSGSAVTLVGAMLGKESVCPGARAGGTSCGATQWVADTSITCIRAGLTSGLGGSSKVVMTLGRSRGQGSISEALSFDAGSVQGLLNQVNAPRGQAGVATIVGKEFGPYGMTGQVRAGGSSAASSLWTSSTSIVCKIREGGRGELELEGAG